MSLYVSQNESLLPQVVSNILSQKIKVADTENWFQEWDCFCDKSDQLIQKPQEMGCERCLKGFGAESQKSPRTWSLTNSYGTLEYQID